MGGQVMSVKRQIKKISIKYKVGSLFLIATTLTALVAISLQFYFGKQESQEKVLSKLTMASTVIGEHVNEIALRASNNVRILNNISIVDGQKFSQNQVLEIFVEILRHNPLFYSIYYGKENEDFYQIIKLDSFANIRQSMNASEDERWVVVNIHGYGDKRTRMTHYFNEQLVLTRSMSEPSGYFPTQRPWYVMAKANEVNKTEPYLFQHLKVTGQTYSMMSKDAVIGIDIVLSSMASKLGVEALGLGHKKDIEAYLINREGEIIASNRHQLFKNSELPEVTPLPLSPAQQQLVNQAGSLKVSNQTDWFPYDFANAGEPQGYTIDLLNMVAQMTGLKLEYMNGFNIDDLSQRFQQGDLDILNGVSVESNEHVLFSAPLVSDRPALLKEQNRAEWPEIVGVVRGQQWHIQATPQVKWVEFDDINQAVEAFRSGVVDGIYNTYWVLNSLNLTGVQRKTEIQILDNLPQIPIALAMKSENVELLKLINQAFASITPEQHTWLQNKWFSRQSIVSRWVPYSVLYEASQQPAYQGRMLPITVLDKKRYLYVVPVSNQQEYFAVLIPQQLVTEQVLTQLWKSLSITVGVMLILLPIAWWFGTPIVKPIIQLIHETNKIKRREFDDVQWVDSQIKEISELSTAMTDMVKEIIRHEKAQEEFVEAFIQLIAGAIDDKSSYTAGHCNRVPELGMMLAKAVEEAGDGKFKDFRFADAKEWREFRIAAWLHDCGKITTPEHIVDKGSKLEANYNRIHEIRTRFEVLWRDAQIEALQSQLNGTSKVQAEEACKQRQEKLQEEFAFIANANVGSEFMSEESLLRIREIAAQTWVRHFDDRLGLSPVEEMNKPASTATLPTTEQLLMDRPEHVIHRERAVNFDPKFGIKIDVPEHLYNLGEIYNLSIRAGTLTAEDRYKINEHMISGIKMLESLPFPKELSRVPRYASTHHETLKGTGYPRKLSAEELSIPERILVIADIFEALTASDRPYKKAKPLSVAVDIMYKMACDQHIDKDLFLLFLKQGVHLEYARIFLPEKQIDEVNIEQCFQQEIVA
nr:HD domain-containing phosphohydrolase [Vibrio metoecus]